MNNRILFYLLFFLFAFSLFSQESLKVAGIFSDGMVIQRKQEITVWGTANLNETVSLNLKSKSFSSKVNVDGTWEIILPEQHVGEPIEIKITTQKDTIVIKDILVGEVWLASGQSNMHLDLNRTLNGEEVAAKANNPNIRIYNMKPTYPTGKEGRHTLTELDSIQKNLYFKTKGWVKVTPKNVLYFSAVAYYFAEKLQKELNIPVGMIHNAVPGAPIEAWMSEESLEQDTDLSSFLKERWRDKEDEKDAMISVAKNQISPSKNSEQKHPWMPSYDYKNGILPIKKYKFKGVIWYQGESNAEHPEVYKTMFQKMVKTWRADFKNDFPFYYVQLTSREDRPAWSEFRNAQRELLFIVPNSKMVVITDVGDRQDTHAKNKKPVGVRLATLALGNSYHLGNNYECPTFDKMEDINGEYQILFKGKFKGLKTSDQKDIKGFEISENGKDYKEFIPVISGNKLKFRLLENKNECFYVRYAWKSFTEANLVSGAGLPLSTFSIRFLR